MKPGENSNPDLIMFCIDKAAMLKVPAMATINLQEDAKGTHVSNLKFKPHGLTRLAAPDPTKFDADCYGT